MQRRPKTERSLILSVPGYWNCKICAQPIADAVREGDVYIVDSVFKSPKFPLHSIVSKCASNSLLWVDGGESAKQWHQVKAILDFFQSRRLIRNSRVVVIGGGTLCDLGSFAASIYLRGLPLHLIPTTLLAMVDAAIGGKTGINFNRVKNSVGTFYPAKMVSIDTKLLSTLSSDQRREGYAELIKAALLGDNELFAMLAKHASDLLAGKQEGILEEIVWRAIAVKYAIVQKDFRESGERALLNLGHTFAHALEASSAEYSHGIAVAWGLRCAAALSIRIGLADEQYRKELSTLLDTFSYPLQVNADPADLLHAMQFDKKREGAMLRFVLQSSPGHTELRTVAAEAVREVLLLHTN